jgi:hydroxyacylglutathione hydrolase
MRVERFVNELMSSNCFVVSVPDSDRCIVIDPGTENCIELTAYLDANGLTPDYIILTHEHTDHTWGCNTLIDRYDAKVLCSEACKKALPKEGRNYFLFYYDDLNYVYSVKRVDHVLEELQYALSWNGLSLRFLETPGHSDGSVCLSIGNALFTGDTIMQCKPYVHKKRGSMEKYKASVELILNSFDRDVTTVYPGHGAIFILKEYENEC